MADSLRSSRNLQEFSHYGEGEGSDEVSDLKRDLEGWREVLIPLSRLLRWDEPYYPVIIAGTTTFLFMFVWFTEMSALTAISLACMLVGLTDFLVPFMGPTITGYKTWTAVEESKFTGICGQIVGVRQDIIDTWHALVTMRHHNAKMFFLVTMGILTVTAWIGNLIDNLFLSYLLVNFVLLLPGLRHHQLGHKYLQPLVVALNKLKGGGTSQKTKVN